MWRNAEIKGKMGTYMENKKSWKGCTFYSSLWLYLPTREFITTHAVTMPKYDHIMNQVEWKFTVKSQKQLVVVKLNIWTK